MESLLTTLSLGETSLATLGVVAILGLITGRLVTLREHNETRTDRDQWKSMALESRAKTDKVIEQLVKQNGELIEGNKLSNGLVTAVDSIVETQRSDPG